MPIWVTREPKPAAVISTPTHSAVTLATARSGIFVVSGSAGTPRCNRKSLQDNVTQALVKSSIKACENLEGFGQVMVTIIARHAEPKEQKALQFNVVTRSGDTYSALFR